jgi:hypothetical protein
MDQDIVCDIDYTQSELRLLARYGDSATSIERIIGAPSTFSAPYAGRRPGWYSWRKTGKSALTSVYTKWFGSLCTAGERPEGFKVSRIAGAVRSALPARKRIGNSSVTVTGRIQTQEPQHQEWPRDPVHDPYKARASKMFNVPTSCVTDEMRRRAKAAYFAELFNHDPG